jgi:16S rRNA (cytidine1402-2'-O)-methyltransferase
MDEASATLYVIPTPLGNLADVTLRSLDVLGAVDVVAAEDTRRTRKLLDHHGIETRPMSLHRFNETATAERIVEILASGRDVAYVTDAGTPAVSDPGARLVRAVRQAGYPVIPLPGASAPTCALSASGWEGPFVFEGYLHRKGRRRSEQLERIAAETRATILFEAPTRLRSTLEALADVIEEHPILVGREMTKLHEQYEVGTAAQLIATLPQRVRGEITLVIMPPDGSGEEPGQEGLDPAARAALELKQHDLPLKRGCAILASATGLSSRGIYERALKLSGRR